MNKLIAMDCEIDFDTYLCEQGWLAQFGEDEPLMCQNVVFDEIPNTNWFTPEDIEELLLVEDTTEFNYVSPFSKRRGM